MAKRNESMNVATAGGAETDAVEQRVVAFAEQLGRMVGTVQAKAEGWLDRDALKTQVSSVRDSAADLLKQLAGEKTGRETGGRTKPGQASAAKKATANSKGRGPVDAPGKRHRKAIPNPVGVKASDTRIAKMKLAKETRRRSHD
jgi:hypothetical protein